MSPFEEHNKTLQENLMLNIHKSHSNIHQKFTAQNVKSSLNIRNKREQKAVNNLSKVGNIFGIFEQIKSAT